MNPVKGLVVNKWSFFKGESLQRAWLFVRLSWGNTGGLSSVTGWTWSVTCVSVLSLSTEGGVYPWPVCAKEQEKYTSCMFILSAIMLVYWGCVNTWVHDVYSFLIWEKKGLQRHSTKFIKITTGILYLHHLWCMTWIQHVLHERRMKEKTVSMLCNHSAQKWSGCASVFFCRDFCKNYILQAKYAHMHCTLCVFPLWILFSLLKYLKICFRPCAEYCWLSQRFPPSLLSMYLKKKTFKMSNWKFRIYENRKKLGREVHPEMNRRAHVHWF